MKKLSVYLGIIIAFAYFALGVLTLVDYGINWDAINHLPRGQAYLHYFLTGKKDYSDLPGWEEYYQNPDSLAIDADRDLSRARDRRSFYQADATTMEWFMEHDGDGHPPTSDILSALFNRVLFGWLGIVNDVDAHRVYGVTLAAILVYLVYQWMKGELGNFPALFSALTLMSYPLFWSEMHFNTEKDIPETVYWSLMMYFVYQGVVRKRAREIVLSGVFFGLAMGTKFNIVFSGVVVILFLGYSMLVDKTTKEYGRVFFWGVLAVLIGGLVFVGFWPYLWPNVWGRVLEVVGYYKKIGVAGDFDPRFIGIRGINTYPLWYILYSTFPIVIALGLVGAGAAIYRVLFKKDKFAVLVLLWFWVPVARVVAPGTSIYGGIRQIMEYVPALSMITGYGAWWVMEKARRLKRLRLGRVIVGFALLAGFLPSTWKLVEIHPYENVYFNFLVGELAGAKEKDIPYWGNTFGAGYRKGFSFINRTAEKGEKVVFVHELMSNFPRVMVRRDLRFWNSNRSGYLREGEYAITLTGDGEEGRSYYDNYLNKFLEPVYVAEVDGVPIVKVWKNDEEYLKAPWVEKKVSGVEISREDGLVTADFGELVELVRMEMNYRENQNCVYPERINFEISRDGEDWGRMPENLPNDWLIPLTGQQPRDGKFIHPFAGEKIRFVRIDYSPDNACISNFYRLEWFGLKN